jgi:hypothetical protein
MAKKKTSQRELSKLRADYLEKREEILRSKVSGLSVKLFDRVFEQYLVSLEQNDGKVVLNERNVNMVKGLDAIYKVFRDNDNVPVVKSFVGDLKEIVPLNERYFKNIAQRGVRAEADKAREVVNKQLGLNENGELIEGGYTDKFIRDESVLKKIKKETMKSLTKGVAFQDLRQTLSKTIKGAEGTSGALEQYYRNNAYDTFQKVDRLNQDLFAKELSLRYFFWQGGLIKTSRPICEKCNGKIIDGQAFKELSYDDLKDKYQNGMDETWEPLNDLGGFGCRHSKDYITDSIAYKFSDRIVHMNELTN